MNKTSPVQTQKLLVAISVVLFVVKMLAWILTGSVAILTDALESTVNVIAGFVGLYSLIVSSRPKDQDHPYGHGKVEFISSAIEGTLILVAGALIIYEAILNLWHPHALKKLDYGLILVGSTAVLNYILGHYCERKGQKEKSPILISSGVHLKSDTYSTLGLLLGIALLWFTGYNWIDSAVAILFALLIMYSGYRILRKSVSGIMDEQDDDIIAEIVAVLNEHRQARWIDVHNMRVINYAGFYHIDCHLTVPYYFNVNEGHQVLDTLTSTLTAHFQDKVEFFIHIDGCIPTEQCSICKIENCSVRQSAFVELLPWTPDNILSNQKHTNKTK